MIGVVALAAGKAGAQTVVNFTLSLNTTASPGDTFTNYTAAGGGTGSEYAIGFQVAISSLDGTPFPFPAPMASFCTELAESIGTSTYNHLSVPLWEATAGTAGVLGTTSSAMPSGGIGNLAAARVRYLFDTHYVSTSLTGWGFTTANPSTTAFQLALWEVTHDSDLDMQSSAGAVYVSTQGNTRRDNAISLAQSWLDEIAAANVTAAYASTTFNVWALASTTGNGSGGFQDILFASRIGTPEDDYLVPRMAPVPEPATGVLSLLAMLMAGRRRRA